MCSSCVSIDGVGPTPPNHCYKDQGFILMILFELVKAHIINHFNEFWCVCLCLCTCRAIMKLEEIKGEKLPKGPILESWLIVGIKK